MADFELTRAQGDRRLYSLDGVGTLRLEGFFSRAATAEANGTSWRTLETVSCTVGWQLPTRQAQRWVSSSHDRPPRRDAALV